MKQPSTKKTVKKAACSSSLRKVPSWARQGGGLGRGASSGSLRRLVRLDVSDLVSSLESNTGRRDSSYANLYGARAMDSDSDHTHVNVANVDCCRGDNSMGKTQSNTSMMGTTSSWGALNAPWDGDFSRPPAQRQNKVWKSNVLLRQQSLSILQRVASKKQLGGISASEHAPSSSMTKNYSEMSLSG